MIRPPPIPNESERLAALEESGLLFSPAEERFDRITRLASYVLETPMAMVSLVGDTRQWFKSTQGLQASIHLAANVAVQPWTAGTSLGAMLEAAAASLSAK